MHRFTAPLAAGLAAALMLAGAAQAAPTTPAEQEQQEAIDSYRTAAFNTCASKASETGPAMERCYVAEIGRQKLKLDKALAKVKAKAKTPAAKKAIDRRQAAWRKSTDAKCSALARHPTPRSVIEARQCALNAVIVRWGDLNR